MIGRFQVMCILQYLRFKKLGLEEEQAKSLALCRAIFYACAKRGYFLLRKSQNSFLEVKKKLQGKIRNFAKKGLSIENTGIDIIGGERAFYVIDNTGKKLYYIGNEIQDEKKWTSSVERRFKTKELYLECLKEAEEYINGFDEGALKSQYSFFNKVYKPVRDEFAKRWSEKVKNLLFVEEGNML